jgi:formylglycine-generating enzyme
MVLIPAGDFLMGSPEGEGEADEHPQRKVYLHPYYIDKYLVTVAQYRKFCEATGKKMPEAPKWGWQDDHPIVYVTWGDAVAYAQHYGKRLPTEAEWEKACRAGTTTKYFFGNNVLELGDYAWYFANSSRQTHPVGTKKPNGFGLYDMYGNAWEWCSDWYDPEYYKSNPTNDLKAPASGKYRVLRGGGWGYTFDLCRSAYRVGALPEYGYVIAGFRCALDP